MKFVLKDVKKDTVVNSVKGCWEVYDEDDNTKLAINSDQDVVNEFKKKSFTAMMTFVTKLWRGM